jgi:hypothetical protein
MFEYNSTVTSLSKSNHPFFSHLYYNAKQPIMIIPMASIAKEKLLDMNARNPLYRSSSCVEGLAGASQPSHIFHPWPA